MRMRYRYFVLCNCFWFASAVADNIKIDAMQCTPKAIVACDAVNLKCEKIPIVTIDGAYLVNVNLKRKFTETYEGNSKVSESKIDGIDRQGELIFLSGFRTEHRGKQLPHSWIAVINPLSGQLTYTSAADGIGLMLSGTCVEGKAGKP
jgi:hypothetical protein